MQSATKCFQIMTFSWGRSKFGTENADFLRYSPGESKFSRMTEWSSPMKLKKIRWLKTCHWGRGGELDTHNRS